MLSAHLFLVCAAVASAVPVPDVYPPPTDPPPPPSSPPKSLVDIDSNMNSKIMTSGGAVVSTTGSTSGSGSVNVVVKAPGAISKTEAVGQTGVSGKSASAGEGLVLQKNRAKTVVDVTDSGIEVKTGTEGGGITAGQAVAAQKAGALGGVKTVKASEFFDTDGENQYKVERVERTQGKSTSGHEASSSGFSTFNVLNLGSTAIKTAGLPSMPKTSAPAPKPEPRHDEYWHLKRGPAPATTTPAPVAPKVLSSESKVKQAAKTSGAGATTTTGATQGSTSSQTSVNTPNRSAKQMSVANSGVTGGGAASGDSFLKQLAIGKTELTKTKDGAKVKTTSVGIGKSRGAAGIIQNVGANGGFEAEDSLKIDLPGLSFGSDKKATGTSSTGHKASSTGDGDLSVNNVAGIDIKLKTPELSLDAIPVPVLLPTTTTPEPPKYKGKW